MRSIVALLLALALVLTAAPSAPAGPHKPPKPLKVKIVRQGEVFCPSAILVFGNVVIAAGRCYTLFILRDTRGSFLAFAAPEAKIPPGQLVRLNTPAGAKVKGRIFYLVPLQVAAAWVPVNAITLVAVRVEDFGPRLAIVFADRPTISVIFTVRL